MRLRFIKPYTLDSGKVVQPGAEIDTRNEAGRRIIAEGYALELAEVTVVEVRETERDTGLIMPDGAPIIALEQVEVERKELRAVRPRRAKKEEQ